MYAHCIHCKNSLGANDSIEALPIGRRLAFDAARGRLWVVCRRCERWNLTPFDERWEALEQCERAFRGTRVRVSSDNIGLAQLPDGTELVRVGAPLRPEFAAWRYGDQFNKRRKRMAWTGAAIGAGALGGAALAISGAIAAGVGIVSVVPLVQIALFSGVASQGLLNDEDIRLPTGQLVRRIGMPKIIAMDVGEGWGVHLSYMSWANPSPPRYQRAWFEGSQYPTAETLQTSLRGNDAMPMLRRLLPIVNRASAPRSVISDGVRLIEDAGGPERFGRWAASQRHVWGARQTYGDTGDIAYIPAAARLAFEMALHEDSERRVMNGELAELQRAWREAEGIAEIADEMLVPESVAKRMEQLGRDE